MGKDVLDDLVSASKTQGVPAARKKSHDVLDDVVDARPRRQDPPWVVARREKLRRLRQEVPAIRDRILQERIQRRRIEDAKRLKRLNAALAREALAAAAAQVQAPTQGVPMRRRRPVPVQTVQVRRRPTESMLALLVTKDDWVVLRATVAEALRQLEQSHPCRQPMVVGAMGRIYGPPRLIGAARDEGARWIYYGSTKKDDPSDFDRPDDFRIRDRVPVDFYGRVEVPPGVDRHAWMEIQGIAFRE